MGRLHLFNPENDLALAAGSANYTPPKAARVLHRAAALLPMWYADAGDSIFAPDANEEWFGKMTARYGLDVELGTEGVPTPWGWSEYAVRQFRNFGHQGPFPDVVRIRELSHRRTALHLHRELQDTGLPYELPAAPREITSPEQLPPGGDFFLKAPWSGSGRGVADCSNMPRSQVEELCRGIVRRQGSVMLEPRMKKIQDFAMLFRSTGHGRVEYRGLSVFFNSSGNAYGGNIVASQPRLAELLGIDCLEETSVAVANALAGLLGCDYCGPLGVDMMLYRGADGRTRICPTVEVNLRMTMGFVALALTRFLPDGKTGVFRIMPNRVEALPGQIPLLPPDSEFTFLLELR